MARPVRWLTRSAVAQVAQLRRPPRSRPQNLDAEESVLGAMMLSPGAIGAVSEILDAADFYRESHAKIYRAALALYAKGEPVDAITLVDELEERGELEDVGGRVAHPRARRARPGDARTPRHYARIVREMATLRGLIRRGRRDRAARLGAAGRDRRARRPRRADRVRPLAAARHAATSRTSRTLLKESFERITQLYEAGADVTGVPSGFRDLDRLTSGLPARQPRHRRRAARAWASRRSGSASPRTSPSATSVPVAIFTLEMSKAEVTQRLMCSEAKVESQRLRTGQARAPTTGRG